MVVAGHSRRQPWFWDIRHGTRLVLTAFQPVIAHAAEDVITPACRALDVRRATDPDAFPPGRYKLTIYDQYREPHLGHDIELVSTEVPCAFGT